jgi:hypothetical protein
MLAQPITQLIRIHQQNRIAAADVVISQDDEKKAQNEVALQVHALYYQILITQLQKKQPSNRRSMQTRICARVKMTSAKAVH